MVINLTENFEKILKDKVDTSNNNNLFYINDNSLYLKFKIVASEAEECWEAEDECKGIFKFIC